MNGAFVLLVLLELLVVAFGPILIGLLLLVATGIAYRALSGQRTG